jgi:Carboxypeptidase regulatory-like domain/TonB dependent receptor-like, beta-barrel/TonB-dependent Receptor Plug Domain
MKLFSLLIALILPCFAQNETADVLGTVKDARASVIAKAVVTLINQETGIESKTTTDENGNFLFSQVKIGKYTVTAEAPGFSKAVATDIAVDVSARQRVELTMQVGAVTETVNVVGAAATLETDSSEHGQVINSQQIVELPLNGRNYADLALLSTNTIKSPMAVSFSPSGTPREAAFNVNGMRSTYNNFLLDGLDNNAYGTSNQSYSSQVINPSPDAISEFKVITSNYSAEYGRVGGAVINAVVKSGTNQIHGAAWEFLRNTDLNAVGFQFSPTVFLKPTLQRNQFGAAIGGPFIKNRLFWFADYEGYRQLQRYLNFDSIPNASDRAGILPVTVVNPLTNVVYPAGTQIPIAQLNPFAAYALTNLPPTNAGAASSRSNNDEALLLIRDYSDKYDAKIDDQINDKMSLFLRFSQRKDIQYYAPDLTGPSGGDGNGYIHTIQQNAALGYTWVTTPSSIFEFRFGFTHVKAGKTPPYVGGPSLQSMFGLQGLPTSSNLTGGLNTQTISGFATSLGRQTSNPQFQNPTSFDPKVNFSKAFNRHSLKMGYELSLIHTEVLDVNPLYGQDTYNGQFSKPTCAQLGQAAGCTIASDTTSYNLADFIFGLPSSVNLGNNFVSNLRQQVHSLYVQDDWRVTDKLTLNLGLRWEFASPLVDRDNNWSDFNPATNTMTRATGGDWYNRALVNPDWKDFGPRLGFAYNFMPKMVLRGGYGISYDFFNRVGSAIEGINAPQALFGVFSQTIPAGGPVPSTFLTTVNSFTTGIANPANFNPLVSNVDYIPANSPWPMIQNWFLSLQRELIKDTTLEIAYNGNHSTRLPIIADYNEATPNQPGGTLTYQQRAPVPGFGPITWVYPGGNNHYNGLSARLEHRFGHGLYALNSFTWGLALGDSEQALEYYAGYVEANPQNIHNLAAERGPSSFDVHFNNVTSVVYQIPFGKGRKYGSNMNAVLDAILGGWELNSINTAHTGTPLNVYYTPATANAVSGLSNDYRGQPFLRPNVSGSSTSQSKSQLINTYFAGYTFTTPPANAPFGNLGRNAFRSPGLEQWDMAVDKTFRFGEVARLQFRSEFFNLPNHTNFGIPNTNFGASAFGTIRATYPARQVQFALKASF